MFTGGGTMSGTWIRQSVVNVLLSRVWCNNLIFWKKAIQFVLQPLETRIDGNSIFCADRRFEIAPLSFVACSNILQCTDVRKHIHFSKNNIICIREGRVFIKKCRNSWELACSCICTHVLRSKVSYRFNGVGLYCGAVEFSYLCLLSSQFLPNTQKVTKVLILRRKSVYICYPIGRAILEGSTNAKYGDKKKIQCTSQFSQRQKQKNLATIMKISLYCCFVGMSMPLQKVVWTKLKGKISKENSFILLVHQFIMSDRKTH